MDNGDRLTTTATAERMAGAASAFLGALTEEQRKQACYGFGDERRSWSYLPARDRDGLPIGALDAGQRKLGHELIVTGTSMPAYAKVVSVIAMEHVLRAMAPESLGGLFDPDRYCFKVFGSPGERRGAGSSPGITCRSTSPWSTAGTSPPPRACWAPSPRRSACSRRWPTTRSSASGW